MVKPKDKKYCEFRACVFDAQYTACIQSDDCETMFAGLRAVLEKNDVEAHVHFGNSLWDAWIPLQEFEMSDDLSESLADIPRKSRHWVRMMVEDERNEAIVFDRTYHPSGEMTEQIPA